MPFYVPAVFPTVCIRATPPRVDNRRWTQFRSQGSLGFQNGCIFESREAPGIKMLLHVRDKLSENF